MSDKGCILITGVSRRLGEHLAHHFLDKDYTVIGTYRSDRPALSALREKGAKLYACDFQDPASVDAFIETIKAEYDTLRTLIHNASDWMAEGKGHEPDIVFDRMMTVHAKVPYLMNLAFKPLLENTPEQLADIVHITDYVAARGSKKHLAYAASKAALENLTLSFAAAFAPAIKVNSIAPALLKFNEGDDDAYKAKALAKASLPWEGSFEEAADAVLYLMHSKYITGRIIPLDGGRHIK